MYIKETEIINQSGLHARPAGLFVATSAKFKSNIKIKNKTTEKSGNAKSIISVLTLALAKGTIVEIMAEGEDEQNAVDSLVTLLESNCGE